MLRRMGTDWKREVLNLYKVCLGPPDRDGEVCSTAHNGTAMAACEELGLSVGWWDDESLFICRPNLGTHFVYARDNETWARTRFVYARDNETWANYLINALRMSEEEKLWFNTALLLDCVGG